MEPYDQLCGSYIHFQDDFYESTLDESRVLLYQLLGNVSEKKILDLGCGSGQDVHVLIQRGANAYGIDNSQNMIAHAKSKYNFNCYSCQNFESTSFDNNSFDIIFSRFAIQHSNNLEIVFKEIYRLLKPSGICLFLVGHPLMQFYFKHNNNYFESENVTIPILDSKIKVQEPSHTFSEYFCIFVLNHFEIIEFKEGPRSTKRETSLNPVIPDFFVVKMKKR